MGDWNLVRFTVLLLLLFESCGTVSGQSRSVGQQRIVKQPTDTVVNLGETVELPCKVENQAGAVQWLRNGFAMGWNRHLPTFPRHQMIGSNADGEYNLQISSVTLDDEDTFVCQLGASADQPAIASRPAKLTVFVPPQSPKFRSHGDVIGAVVGQQEIITCQSAGGKPASDLEWVVADDSEGRLALRRIPADRTNAEANGKVFDVWSQISYQPERSDDGKFLVCRIRDHPAVPPALMLSTAALLRIQYAPQVSVSLNYSQPLREGAANVLLSCNANAKPSTNLVYRWWENDVLLPKSTPLLKLDPLDRSKHHNAIYVCEVQNAVGTSRALYRLLMEYGPRLLPTSQFVAVDEGGTAVLSCPVDSNPPSTVVWTKIGGNGNVLHEGTNYTISNVRSSNAGRYSCSAGIPGLPSVGQNFTLYMTGPPKVRFMSQKIEARTSTDVVLQCHITAYPTLTDIAWFVKNDCDDGEWIPIEAYVGATATSSKERFSYGPDFVYDAPAGGKYAVLKIANAHGSDFVCYNCSAVNSYGIGSDFVRLVENDTLPLYYVLPGIIAGAVVIALVVIALCWCRCRSCGTKQSQSDQESVVIDKVEVLDGAGRYAEWYAESVDYNGRDYFPLPVHESAVNAEFDNLPPPYYYAQPTTFSTNGSPKTNGHLVHMTYLSDDAYSYDPLLAHYNPYQHPVVSAIPASNIIDNPTAAASEGIPVVSFRNSHPIEPFAANQMPYSDSGDAPYSAAGTSTNLPPHGTYSNGLPAATSVAQSTAARTTPPREEGTGAYNTSGSTDETESSMGKKTEAPRPRAGSNGSTHV